MSDEKRVFQRDDSFLPLSLKKPGKQRMEQGKSDTLSEKK